MSEVSPVRLVSLESRRATDLAGLLGRAGFDVQVARSMQEVPLGDQSAAIAFGERLIRADYDLLVLMTGVGFRMLLDAAQTSYSRQALVAGLARRPIACRGPKPVAVLKGLGVRPHVVAPEPNTYRELLAALDAHSPVAGMRVVVQEYGVANPIFDEGLRKRGALLEKVPVYAWALPDDLTPLRAAIERLCTGEADGIVFTSQQQLQHLETVAQDMGKLEPLLQALRQTALVASIGPVTSEALVQRGIEVDIEPVHPKMGHLAKALRDQARRVLVAKRAMARR